MYLNKLNLFGVCVLVVLTAGLGGCTNGDKPGAAKGTDATQPVTPSRGPAKPQVADIPAELKHDGFLYYGFENLLPVDMETSNQGLVSTGARINRLTEIADGKAMYEVENTGSLQILGNQKMSVEKDGIYSTGLSTGKMTPERLLEVPAELTPGKTWKNDSVITFDDGRTFKAQHSYKVVGPQKVQTKAGEFDAILIQAGGPTEQSGANGADPQKFHTDMKIWLVKGVGPVKMELTAKVGGQVQKNVIQATKVNK